MVDGLPENSTGPLLQNVEDDDTGQTALLPPTSARGCYVWRVENWSHAQASHFLLSPKFRACGYTWKLLCFPHGNLVGSSHVSLFLDGNEAEQQLQGSRHATMKLMIKNQLYPSRSALKETKHAFTLKDFDWGYNQFMLQGSLKASQGFVVNDTLVIEVYIRLDRFESFDNSKKETGHVGVKSAGAICERESRSTAKDQYTLVSVSTQQDMYHKGGPQQDIDLQLDASCPVDKGC